MLIHRTRTIVSTLSLSLALLSVVACKSEIDDKPKAKVEAAGEVEPKPADKPGDADKPAATTLALATEGSSIGFIGAKITGDHKGSFGKFKGSATVEGEQVTSLEIIVEIGSLTTDAEQLTTHMLSADFFEAETYPEAKFTSLSITAKPGEDGATHEIAGNLELKGQAKKVTFPATLTVAGDSVHGKAAFSIDRKEWGITYAGKPDDLIKDDVALELDLKFPKV